MKTAALLLTACLLAACGQKGPLVQPGHGPENTQYIIKGSDQPRTPPAAPATPAPAATPASEAAHAHD